MTGEWVTAGVAAGLAGTSGFGSQAAVSPIPRAAKTVSSADLLNKKVFIFFFLVRAVLSRLTYDRFSRFFQPANDRTPAPHF
jgi:hypothetical protein